MIERRYAKAWFSWLEWIGLTALVCVAARRVNSGFLLAVAVVSMLALFFVALAGVEKLRDEILPHVRGGKILVLFAAVGLSILGLWIVTNVLFELLPASAA